MALSVQRAGWPLAVYDLRPEPLTETGGGRGASGVLLTGGSG